MVSYGALSKIFPYFVMGWWLGIGLCITLEYIMKFFSMQRNLEKYASQRRKSTVSAEISLVRSVMYIFISAIVPSVGVYLTRTIVLL